LVDYIIVGQGLAGSTLALKMCEQNKSFIVFDEPASNRSSAIAAGLFNPVTGKLMTKTWMAEKIFPELHRFYSWAEKKLGHRFYYPQPIYRPFLSVAEQNEWMGKSVDPALRDYIHKVFTQSRYGNQVHDPFGGIVLKECGYLDVLAFLHHIKNHLISIHSFVPEKFDDTLLEIKDQQVRYKDIDAGKIIFCNGIAMQQQSITGKAIPIRLLKGETLIIELEESLELIYNRGVYMVPMHQKNRYKAGATYESKLLTAETTLAGRSELQQKLDELLKLPYKIVSQDWGFRPTTPDRKPILGCLPGCENVVIFNGLGTKGVSLAPYFSGQLMDWLLGETEIQSEVNINRFKSLFSKSRGVV
jgi:glycine oxidase